LSIPSPLQVVIAQLDAYNARDIDAFCATFTLDVAAYELDTGVERLRGHEGLRARYGPQFAANPRQRSMVVSRQELGEMVFDLEFITGYEPAGPGQAAPPPFHMMAVYRVRGGLIDRCWFSPRVTVS